MLNEKNEDEELLWETYVDKQIRECAYKLNMNKSSNNYVIIERQDDEQYVELTLYVNAHDGNFQFNDKFQILIHGNFNTLDVEISKYEMMTDINELVNELTDIKSMA